MDDFKTLKTKLNAQGYRLTPQRQLIFEIFQTLPTGNHLNAESVHSLLLERGGTMSLSTVYRILKIMTNMGLIREVELAQAQKHYEFNTISTYHHHIVCVQCHQIIEFENNSIIQQGLKQVETMGLQLIDCKFTLQTICPQALQRGWPTISSNWVCPRFMKTDKTKKSTHQQLDLPPDIQEKTHRIGLKEKYIVVYTPKDEIKNYQHEAKLIPGWRLSREDMSWYFPLEKAADVLNVFQGYEVDPQIFNITV
ncbi:MAG: transcriptional repressor [Nostoc sp. LLA-1]|nr:transcriptional repressor [Cyanocohniella sp. LLY]